MRLDASHRFARRAHVFLEGDRVYNCMEADDLGGFVVTIGPPILESGVSPARFAEPQTTNGGVSFEFNPPLTAEERDLFEESSE